MNIIFKEPMPIIGSKYKLRTLIGYFFAIFNIRDVFNPKINTFEPNKYTVKVIEIVDGWVKYRFIDNSEISHYTIREFNRLYWHIK